MMSVIRSELAVARPISTSAVIDRFEIGARHMRQDQVLLMADADLVEGVFLGEIGDRFHLAVAGVARHCRRCRFSEIVTARIVGIAMRAARSGRASRAKLLESSLLPARTGSSALRPLGQSRRREIGVDGADVGFRQLQLGILQRLRTRPRPGG